MREGQRGQRGRITMGTEYTGRQAREDIAHKEAHRDGNKMIIQTASRAVVFPKSTSYENNSIKKQKVIVPNR